MDRCPTGAVDQSQVRQAPGTGQITGTRGLREIAFGPETCTFNKDSM
jgi:hypothetical protein